MQTYPISPSGEATAGGPEEQIHADESPKKKSIVGKVKDKARKLKTKIKKPKSPGAADNNGSNDTSSSEDESGSEPQQQSGELAGEERDVVSTPGLQGDAIEAIPDPHVSDAPAGSAGVERQLGQMNLEDKPDSTKLQEKVPTAPGVTPYLASHNLGERPDVPDASRSVPVDEGKDAEGKDLLVSPTSDYQDNPLDKSSEEKPLKDHVSEGVVAATAASAGAAGVKSLSDESGNAENTYGNVPGENKSITERATDTATGLKDTVATKLGYGSDKNLTSAGDASAAAAAQDPANKSVLQKIQESAAGVTGVVTSKLGYGDKPEGVGIEGVPGDNKTYTQKAYDAAYGAKDAVAAKLGYGGVTPTNNPVVEGEQKSYLQQAQDSAVGAKDTVASKLGYANREVPASTDSAYTGEQNVPASTTAARFHPGEEDRALSQLITEKMSTGASTVKDTLLRPFGASKSGSPTPTTTPPPSSGLAVAEDPLHNTVPSESSQATGTL